MSLIVNYADVYRNPNIDHTQITTCPWVGLHVSGIKLWELPGYGISEKTPGPFLLALPQGVKIHFQTVAPRENWIAFLLPNTIEPSARPGLVKVNYEGLSAELPPHIKIDESSATSLQLEFIRMRDGCASPLAQMKMLGALSIASVIRTALERTATVAGYSPAKSLRALMDRDPSDWTPLSELAQKCGFSINHLRSLFIKEFGMNPNEYREKRRMSVARDLLVRSGLSVKEVAEKLGFSYVSHFSANFKASSGLTPSECIRRFRQK